MRKFRTTLLAKANYGNQETLPVHAYNARMTGIYAPLLALLSGTLVPRLKEIQTGQDEQRLQAERLERDLADLRFTLSLHFAEIRADLAACQERMEDILVTLRDAEAGPGETLRPRDVKKSLLH